MARNKFILKKLLLFFFLLVAFFLSPSILSKGIFAVCGDPVGCGATIPCSDSGCGSGCPLCSTGGKPLGTFKGLGVLSEFIDSLTRDNPGPAASAFTNFISKAIGIMTVVAFIWFIFNLFIGAIGWLSSGGDKAKLQEAQKKITTNLTGLVIVISAIFLTKIISLIFGINILDLTNFITTLGR